MNLSLETIDKDGIVHVEAAGNITGSDIPVEGKDPFEQVLGANWASNRVLLNLGKVSYIDSSAIGWLIGAHRAFTERGGRLVVHSIQPTVRQIMDVLQIGKVVPLADGQTAARAVVDGGAA